MDNEDAAEAIAPPRNFLGFARGLTIDEIARASAGRDPFSRVRNLRSTLTHWHRQALGYDADPGQVALAAIELMPVALAAQRVLGLLGAGEHRPRGHDDLSLD